jgi:hypothetical protein
MTEQQTSPDDMSKFMRDVVRLWMKVVFGGAMLLTAAFAAVSVLRHGSRSLGFLLMALSLAGWWLFMGQPTEPAITYLKGPQGILYLLWIAVFIAWFIQSKQWVPAICIGGSYILALFTQQHQRMDEVWWRYYLRRPLMLAPTLFFCALILWFAWNTGAWIPVICVVATLPFLECDIKVRRSLKENLVRRSFAASLLILLVAGIWMSIHLTFGPAFGFVIITCLIVSDLYPHTSSNEELLALSHSQS